MAPLVSAILKGLTPGQIEAHPIDEPVEQFVTVRTDLAAITVETSPRIGLTN